MDERIAARFRVTGRVQRVGFRASATRHGRALGLDGTASNLRDGSVEVEVAGAPQAVEQMGNWLAHGPAYAQVAHVERQPIDADQVSSGFAVR